MCNLFIIAILGLIVGILGITLAYTDVIELPVTTACGFVIAFIFGMVGLFQILQYNVFLSQKYEPTRIAIAENYTENFELANHLNEINIKLINYKSTKTIWGNWCAIPDSVLELEFLENNK